MSSASTPRSSRARSRCVSRYRPTPRAGSSARCCATAGCAAPGSASPRRRCRCHAARCCFTASMRRARSASTRSSPTARPTGPACAPATASCASMRCRRRTSTPCIGCSAASASGAACGSICCAARKSSSSIWCPRRAAETPERAVANSSSCATVLRSAGGRCMALLTSLGLKPTKAMATSAPPKTTVAEAPKGNAAAKPDDDPARKAALALGSELKARLNAAQAEPKRLSDGQEKLKKIIAAAQGDQKKALEGKQKLLDKAVADAEKNLTHLSDDVEALANPATKREEYAAILARAKSKASIAPITEIDTGAESLAKKLPGEVNETRTRTAYADGRAVTTKEEKKRSIGLDGVTQTHAKEVTETTG